MQEIFGQARSVAVFGRPAKSSLEVNPSGGRAGLSQPDGELTKHKTLALGRRNDNVAAAFAGKILADDQGVARNARMA